jgi:hypothetical protein
MSKKKNENLLIFKDPKTPCHSRGSKDYDYGLKLRQLDVGDS